jgi:chemotaxis family two-component system response regulator Rcp1
MRADSGEPLHILLVEDNPADVRLTQELLKEVPILTSLSVVGDGEQAMAFLRREGQYAGAPLPDFILLDLRLPRKDGYEVLSELHSDPILKTIPVAVCLGSEFEKARLERYHLPVDCFFVKSFDPDQLTRVLTSCWAAA